MPESWPLEHPSPSLPHLTVSLAASEPKKVENSHRCCWILQILLIPLEGLMAKVTVGVRRRLHRHKAFMTSTLVVTELSRHLWGCELWTPTSPASFHLHGEPPG